MKASYNGVPQALGWKNTISEYEWSTLHAWLSSVQACVSKNDLFTPFIYLSINTYSLQAYSLKENSKMISTDQIFLHLFQIQMTIDSMY